MYFLTLKHEIYGKHKKKRIVSAEVLVVLQTDLRFSIRPISYIINDFFLF